MTAVDHDRRTLRTIEVFADIQCPFTHVGLRRLTAHRNQLRRADVALRLRAWPLELVNGEPLSRELLTEEIAELRASVAPDLFTGFEPDLFPMPSLPAMALANRAYRLGAQHGEAVSLAIRNALFERGGDLSDPALLAFIAREFGLGEPDEMDAAAVLADLEEGRSRGVIGSPHFFVAGESFFCPTLSIERVDGHMEIAFDPDGFATFVERCFEPDDR